MTIFQLSDTRYAIGTTGKIALYVLNEKKGVITGQRGKRPVLTEGRYPKAKKTSAELRAAFKAALGA